MGRLTQPGAGRSSFNIAVITIIALHAMFFGGLLLQGCKPKTETGLSDLASGAPTNALSQPGGLGPAYPETTNFAGLNGQAPAFGATSSPPAPTNSFYFPPPTQPVTPEPPPVSLTTTEYAIAKGDTLAKIAKKHGVTLAQLEAANPNLDSRKLQINQKIQIPASAPKGNAAAEPGVADAGAAEPAGKVYAVKAGDTLTKIAKSHGVTPRELRSFNNLKTDRITVNQKIKIPPAKAAAPAGGAGPGSNVIADPAPVAPSQPVTNPAPNPGPAVPPPAATGGPARL
jgi:LysM repeat protein